MLVSPSKTRSKLGKASTHGGNTAESFCWCRERHACSEVDKATFIVSCVVRRLLGSLGLSPGTRLGLPYVGDWTGIYQNVLAAACQILIPSYCTYFNYPSLVPRFLIFFELRDTARNLGHRSAAPVLGKASRFRSRLPART